MSSIVPFISYLLHFKAEPLTKNIHINSDWLVHMSKLSTKSLELKRHQHLLFVKGLHEIGHILTPLFMEQLQMKKTKKGYLTLKRIGTMKQGKNTIGDAGYGLEEILNGGRIFIPAMIVVDPLVAIRSNILLILFFS